MEDDLWRKKSLHCWNIYNIYDCVATICVSWFVSGDWGMSERSEKGETKLSAVAEAGTLWCSPSAVFRSDN